MSSAITDPITNRPGLSQVSYRIGRYSDFRALMLAILDGSEPLRGLTYRRADDPAVALLEGAAILADILAFYQDQYANQAFLRSATWRESTVDLVYLTGYRARPAVGGRGAFAFELEDGRTAQLAAGMRLRAELAGSEKAVELETTSAIEARATWSRIPIQRPVLAAAFGTISSKLSRHFVAHRTLRLLPADPNGLPVALAKGDRLLLGAAAKLEPPFEISPPQTVVVAEARSERGFTVVDIVGTFSPGFTNTPIVALKLGRTFRHFGHNAPPSFTTIDRVEQANGVKQEVVSTTQTVFERPMGKEARTAATQFKTDVQVDDLSAGSYALWAATPGDGPNGFDVVGTILRTSSETLEFQGPFSAPTTIVTLDASPSIRGKQVEGLYDIRSMRLFEILGSPLLALPLEVPTKETRGNRLEVFLPPRDAEALLGRTLVFSRPDADAIEATVTAVGPRSSPWSDERPSVYPLTIDRELDYADLPPRGGRLVAFGNVALATQGRSENELAIGSGDGRAAFQVFPLPTQALTYLVRPDAPNPVPELDVLVRGESWSRVDALYGAGPRDHVYVVREDDAGRSYVGFGDGINGARLPSGLDNVTVRFRSGAEAFGPLADGATVTTRDHVPGLKAIRLPGVVSGGAAAESGDHAKRVAPARTQTLGRLVTLPDISAEAAQIPGVARARASWSLRNGVPAIQVTLLMDAGRERELSDVTQILEQAYQGRGAGRHPLFVEPARFVDLEIAAEYGARASRRRADIEQDMRAAIADTGDSGLFGAANRELGAVEYRTRIEGMLQNIPGVLWASVTRLARVGIAAQKLDLVPCAPTELLRLKQLELVAVAVPGGGV